MIRNNPYKDITLFYEMMDESENVEELNETVKNLTESMQQAIQDLCDDMEWDRDDVENFVV